MTAGTKRFCNVTGTSAAKLADFGLARHIEDRNSPDATGRCNGHPGHMAPEQAEGRTQDVGPDRCLWALGVMLYELLTGHRPFTEAIPGRHNGRGQVDPIRPRKCRADVARDMETICLKCLEKRADNRYASALELANDLRRFREGLTIAARPVGLFGRLARRAQRHPVAAAIMLVLVASAPVAVWGAREWRQYQQKTDREEGVAQAQKQREDREQQILERLRSIQKGEKVTFTDEERDVFTRFTTSLGSKLQNAMRRGDQVEIARLEAEMALSVCMDGHGERRAEDPDQADAIRAATRWLTSSNNLKALSIALHNRHGVTSSWPNDIFDVRTGRRY